VVPVIERAIGGSGGDGGGGGGGGGSSRTPATGGAVTGAVRLVRIASVLLSA
jgi:hypothetical protein